MKLKTVAMLIGLSAVCGAQAAGSGGAVTGGDGESVKYEGKRYVRVSTAEQFVRSIGSGKDILVAKNTVIDLTPVLLDADWWHNNSGNYKWLPAYESMNLTGKNIVSEEVFDGRQLSIVGFKKINIVGEGDSHIVVEPRYSFCLNFVNCEEVTLRNLIIGHTEGGYCEGGVLGVAGGKNISIYDCDLYGCGTYGLELSDTRDFSMYGSDIHDCTYGIMTLNGVESARFDRCDFYRNKEYALVEGHNSGLSFNDCRFYANNPTSILFNVDREFELTDCVILHPAEYLGNVDDTQQSGNWLCEDPYDSAFFVDGSGPERIEVDFKGEEPTVVDFINAITRDGTYGEGECADWVKAWKDYQATGGQGGIYTCEADAGNGYARIERNSADGRQVTFHDFRCWDRYDGNHKLFAHSSGTLIDGKAAETECFGLAFYDYNPKTRKVSYIGYDTQVLGARPCESDNIVYRLSDGGSDIVYVGGDGEGGVYLWNGDIFMKGEAFGY